MKGPVALSSDSQAWAFSRALLLGLVASLSAGCVTSADHEACRQSCECKTLGNCSATRKGCAPSNDEQCQSSRACAVFGRCAHEDGRCVTRSDEHCKAADVCTKGNLCRFADGRCVM
jgi:hypothetical protein